MAVAWLLAALHPRGPYPVLALAGEQGSAKSSFTRVLRGLIDPNFSPLRALPRENRDLSIAAGISYAIVFDNVSDLPDSLSDSLCRLATGGGFATRQLRTDSGEVLFVAMRPIILNGIEDFITRPDLAERTVFLLLDEISEDRRQEERELWKAFEDERPYILGALLDAVAHGMKMLPKTELARLPRMADFARWVTACEGALWEPGTFLTAYNDNRDAAVESALAADAIAVSVRSWMAIRSRWEGTTTDLLAVLAAASTDVRRSDKKWPADGRMLLGRLRRVTPSLRHIGIIVQHFRVRDARNSNITITHATERRRKSMSDQEVARRDEVCRGHVCHCRRETTVGSDFAQAYNATTERGAAGAAEPAIEVEFAGSACVRIPASTPTELAMAVVKALSQR